MKHVTIDIKIDHKAFADNPVQKAGRIITEYLDRQKEKGRFRPDYLRDENGTAVGEVKLFWDFDDDTFHHCICCGGKLEHDDDPFSGEPQHYVCEDCGAEHFLSCGGQRIESMIDPNTGIQTFADGTERKVE